MEFRGQKWWDFGKSSSSGRSSKIKAEVVGFWEGLAGFRVIGF